MIYKLNSDLTFKKYSPTKWKVLLGLSLILNFVLIGAVLKVTHTVIEVPKIVWMQNDSVIEKDIELTDSSLTDALIHYGCVLPSVALAQAKIESSNYHSDIARENKNLFGIKYHKCKYVMGEHRGHASYASYRDNILCYIHVQDHYLKNIDGVYAAPGQYVHILKTMR